MDGDVGDDEALDELLVAELSGSTEQPAATDDV